MSDPIDLSGISLSSALAIQARMVRNDIAPNQLAWYWDSDTNREIDPLDDPGTRSAIKSLIGDLWRATAEVRTQHVSKSSSP